jgi:hypothetical protein
MGVCVLGLRIVGGAMKEGRQCGDRQGGFLVKKSEGLMRPGRKTRQRKCWLTLSFNQSRRMSIDLDFFGRTEEVARPIAHSLSTKRRGGDCWGWPRLMSVSVSSANTYPPPKAAAYSASAIDATTTRMRWQKAWRGALWVVGEGSGWEGCDWIVAEGSGWKGWDWMRREARTRDCFSFRLCLRLSGGGLRR